MRKAIIIIKYHNSQWGSDLVEFTVPDTVRDYQILDEIEYARQDLDASDYASQQDMMDIALSNAAGRLEGTWNYVAQAGVVDVWNDDGDDDDDWEDEEDDSY